MSNNPSISSYCNMTSVNDPFDGKTRAECWYADIINLPHHESKVYAHMPMHKRAAQFAPFAALSTYHESLLEESRYTETLNELSDDELEHLNSTLQRLLLHRGEQISICVKYFVPDNKKLGGHYVVAQGLFAGYNTYKNTLLIKVRDMVYNIRLRYVVNIEEL